MMASYFSNSNKLKSLAAQIRYAELQISQHQRRLKTYADMLTGDLRQQMASPGTLLLSGGIGFILAELTKSRRSRKSVHKAENPPSAEPSPISSALNLFSSIRTLYTALPLAWVLKSFYRPEASAQASAIKTARKMRSRRPYALRRHNVL